MNGGEKLTADLGQLCQLWTWATGPLGLKKPHRLYDIHICLPSMTPMLNQLKPQTISLLAMLQNSLTGV